MLESIHSEDISIRRLQEQPESKPELPVDVDRDIDEDSKKLFIAVMEARKEGLLTDYCTYAAIIKRLWPDYELNLPEEKKESLENILDQVMRGQVSTEAAAYAAKIITVYPELSVNLMQKTLDTWKKVALEWENRRNYYALTKDYFFLKIINPSGDYSLTTDQINKLKAAMESIRILPGRDPQFIRAAAHLKLLVPEHAIDISHEMWAEFKNEIKNSPAQFDKFELAAYLKILAAHKVTITSPGVIEFEMYPPSHTDDSMPSIPEEREF